MIRAGGASGNEMYVTDMIASTSVSNVNRALYASGKVDKGGKVVLASDYALIFHLKYV